jgi:hypothetical protein
LVLFTIPTDILFWYLKSWLKVIFPKVTKMGHSNRYRYELDTFILLHVDSLLGKYREINNHIIAVAK